jgi:hypothetical protein
MSFDANIGRAQPIIKPATNMNNDGGSGGNTGYMMQGRRKKDEEKRSLFDSGAGDIDSVEFSAKLPKNQDTCGYKNSWFENMVEKFIK